MQPRRRADRQGTVKKERDEQFHRFVLSHRTGLVRTAILLTAGDTHLAEENPDSFIGKIAITLQSQDDHSTPSGTAVPVNGRPGVLEKGEQNAESLWVQQPDGLWMQVQIWDARGWSRRAIVEFADGIHVQPGAQQGRG
jgi:hypothetical protein